MNNEIMIIDPEQAVRAARARKDIVTSLIQGDILRPGIEFGIVPGSKKNVLLKPGAERLCAAFGLCPLFDELESTFDLTAMLIRYRYCCTLVHIESGLDIATGIGSCNSREARYAWRWVDEADIPPDMDKERLKTRNATLVEFAFSVEKANSTGRYGKPAEYWQKFKDAIASNQARAIKRATQKGTMIDAWEIVRVQYRIPNDEIGELDNTIDKIAQKRALIAAALVIGNVNEFFTQDLEGFGLQVSHVDEGSAEIPSPVVNAEPSPKTHYGGNGNEKPVESAPAKAGEMREFTVVRFHNIQNMTGTVVHNLETKEGVIVSAYSRDIFQLMGYTEHQIEDWKNINCKIDFTINGGKAHRIQAYYKEMNNGRGYWSAYVPKPQAEPEKPLAF